MSSIQSSSGDGVVLMKKDRKVDNPDLRRKTRLATWNVLTLNGTGYATSLVRQLGNHHVSIAGITESRLTGSDATKVEDSVILHSGGTQQANGVALILRGPFADTLVSWAPISDRIL